MTDTNNTVLTEQQRTEIFERHFSHDHPNGTDIGRVIEDTERAVLAKLPGMPAYEWLARADELLNAALNQYWDKDAIEAMRDHLRQRIQPAASEADLPEGWRVVERKTCYALHHGNEVIATLAGPDSEANAAILARMLGTSEADSVIRNPLITASEGDPYNYKGMFEGAVRTLAEIDKLLGLPEDGCNDPQATVSALADFIAGHKDMQKSRDDLLDDNYRLASEAGAVPSKDRAMLEAVMNDLDVSVWQCPQCGHAEDCNDMDAALMLRDYLAAPPSAPAAEPVPQAVIDALKAWTGSEPSQSALARAVDAWRDPGAVWEHAHVADSPAAESAEPVTGGTVSELLDAIRHYGSEKWSEGNRHAIAVGDDRKSIRAAWDDVYRLVQLLATQPPAATADAPAQRVDTCASCGNKIGAPDDHERWCSRWDALPSIDDNPERWRRRALEAEELNRKFMDSVNGPTFMGEPAPTAQGDELSGNSGELTQQPSENPGELDAQGDERAIAEFAAMLDDLIFAYADGRYSDRLHIRKKLVAAFRAALSRQPSAAASVLDQYSYQQLFDAIAAAISASELVAIRVSVEAFRAALAAAKPEGEQHGE